MTTLLSGLPDFDHYRIGDLYPWRNFHYNHSQNFLCLSIPSEAPRDQFALHAVKHGTYFFQLTHKDFDHDIDHWIQKYPMVVEQQTGQHLKICHARDVREFIRDYHVWSQTYDCLRANDISLEENPSSY